MDFTVTLTKRQEAGIKAACDTANAELPEGTPQHTVDTYLTARVQDVLNSYVTQHAVTVLSPIDFFLRFTQEERIAVREAAKVSPQIADFLALAERAQTISLEHENTITGVNSLEAAGIITKGRAAEILDLG